MRHDDLSLQPEELTDMITTSERSKANSHINISKQGEKITPSKTINRAKNTNSM
jgi:hypothetical protein